MSEATPQSERTVPPARSCPHARRAQRDGEPMEPRVAREGGIWRVRGLEPARQVLRARHATTQAGFTAEKIPQAGMRHRPILISDGPAHDEQRSAVARFFAPAVVERRYGELMQRCAHEAFAGVQPGARVALDEVALLYTVEVTSEVVGLSTPRPGEDDASRRRRIAATARRLESFFNQPPFDLSRKDLGRSRRQWMQAAWNGLLPVARFWWHDVRPAVALRRRQGRGDVVSHLVDQGCSDTTILVEAVTYGTAGMVTTREFVSMAAWHLLEDPALLQRYRDAQQPERLALLEELIRLEPVVGHLYRRVREPLTLTDRGQRWTLPAGEVVDVCTRATNADPDVWGDDGEVLAPGRSVPRGVPAPGLAFGDGAHRCPGQPLALLETDALLLALLERRPRLVRAPELGWDDLIAGYWLRGLLVELDG